MEKKSRNILLISAVTVAVSGTIAVGMAAHAISKEKQPFVSLPWFMGKYERDERIKAINHLIKKAKESEVKRCPKRRRKLRGQELEGLKKSIINIDGHEGAGCMQV